MTRTLERDKLITERHLTPKHLEMGAIERILIVGTIMVIVAYHAKPQFLTFHLPVFHFYRIVGGLLKAAQNSLFTFLHDANPRTGHIDIAQTSHIAILHSFGIKLDGSDGCRTNDSLSKCVTSPHQLFGRHRLQAQTSVFQTPFAIIWVMVPLPDTTEPLIIKAFAALVGCSRDTSWTSLAR